MTDQSSVLTLALAALKANHQNHQDYDDNTDYTGSELYEQNTKAIAALELLIAPAAQSGAVDSQPSPVTDEQIDFADARSFLESWGCMVSPIPQIIDVAEQAILSRAQTAPAVEIPCCCEPGSTCLQYADGSISCSRPSAPASVSEQPAAQTAGAPGAVSILSSALNHARDALRFYAESNHFHRHQPEKWDTVSGEPQNFYEDSDNTATVEDGSIAENALEDIAAAESHASIAAPQPVAEPDDPWHEAVLHECMRVESCYVKDDSKQTLLNLINWYCKETVAGRAQDQWQEIQTLPFADDLVWLALGDSIDGPRAMEVDDYDRYSHWAPCEPPLLGDLRPQAAQAKEGGK